MSKLITFFDVRDYVAEIINAIHPSYVIKAISSSNYTKISLMSKYEDYCIMRLSKSHNWFSLNNIPGLALNNPLFDLVENKKKNHLQIPITSFEDIKRYEQFFIPIAEYLYKTYEVEKYPYSEDSHSPLSPSGSGITLSL